LQQGLRHASSVWVYKRCLGRSLHLAFTPSNSKMSLTRQFFREMRPLFRMLEEPLGPYTGFPASHSIRQLLHDPFLENTLSQARVPIDLSEESNQYIIEAELPGVKKEDIDVHVSNGGRTVTIEGKIIRRLSTSPDSQSTSESAVNTNAASSADGAEVQPDTAVSQNTPNQLSVERAFTGSTQFTRTVVLPRPVDSNAVTAKLVDGVLTLRIPKAEEPGTVKINVD